MAIDTSAIACAGLHSDAACASGQPALAWALLGSDLLSTAAFLSIPAMLVYIVHKRGDVALSRLFFLFALFIFILGLSHLASLLSRWYDLRTVEALLSVLTALASMIAALALLRHLPQAINMPSRLHLANVISQLSGEIRDHASTGQALRQTRDELETRVAHRTAELFHRNAELQAQIIERDRMEAAFRDSQLILGSAQGLALSSAGFDRRRVTAELLALLAESHPFCTSAMYLPDRRSGGFNCIALHGMPHDGLSVFQFADGILAKAAQSGEIQVLPCTDRTRQHEPEDMACAALVEALVVPVVFQDACLSVLVLAGIRKFTPAEIAFVESLRSQLGVAQHNLHLFTASKRLANELNTRNIEIAQKNLQLQEISRTKSEFVANMSHELRTPLNAVLGFTGTLLMRLPGPLTDDQDKQLRTIQSSARHLLSLINDLLDVEKIESGKFEIRLEHVVLQSVIRDVFDTLQPLAAQKNLEFKMSLPKADITIQTDRRALSQILINLLNNAIKFTEQGQVELQLSRRRTGNFGTVELIVSDTGIGILPERQDQLFQAFTQLDSTSTRNFDGSGLGLYLSRRLATLVGGQLHCKSDFGKGSLFTLALPVQHS